MNRNRQTEILGGIFTVIILVLLIFLSNVETEKTSFFESAVSSVVNPVQKVFVDLKNKIQGNGDYFATIDEVKAENEELKKKNSELETQLRELEMIKAENTQLQQYMHLSDKYANYNTVPAYVINRDVSNFSSTLVLNVGTNDGIKKDMIKVILWDIDGTLLNFLRAEYVSIKKCFEMFNLGECTDEMIARYSAINKKYWEKYCNSYRCNVDSTGNWKNLMCMPLLNESRFIRYCPECAKEDREKYGETYWHREHQIQKIRVCPKHRCFLEDSEIAISAKTSPGLHDAESNVPDNSETKVCNSDSEIEFTQYVIDVMHEPIDLENPLSIGKFLHSRLGSEYSSNSGLFRNITKLYEAYLSFYGEEMPTMALSYLQKIFNGYLYDPYFVLQLAFFLGISVQEITHLPNDIPLYGIDDVYQKLSHRYNLDYAVVEEIGSAVLKYSYNQTRVSRKSGKREALYDELDAQYLPQVKTACRQMKPMRSSENCPV